MLKNSKKYINLLQVLLETKTHIGHKKTDWVPKIAPYILAEYKGLYLLNLEYTIPLLKKAFGLTTRSITGLSTRKSLWATKFGPRAIY